MKPVVQSSLSELLEEIESLADGDGWTMPVEHALSFFPLRPEDFYRFVYAHRTVDALFVPDALGPENFEDFLRFLEQHGWPDAGNFFFRAGYAFGEARRIDLLEFFYSVTVSRLQNHDVDRELLVTALAGCRRPEDGFDFYCAAAIHLDELIEFAAALYLTHRKIEQHAFSKTRVRAVLRAEVRSGAILAEDLFRPLAEVLRTRAMAWGLLDADTEEARMLVLTPEMKLALALMGFRPEKPPGRSALKNRYRELMKQYHPDINPGGEVKSRELNSAYSLLLARLDKTR